MALVLQGTRLAPMSLEEHSIETAGERCEECGARLTPSELEAVLESGGPTLCAIHAAEDEPGLAADDEIAGE
jgi:hypothetical protein